MQAFSLDAAFSGGVLAQQIEGDVANDGKISRGMVFANSGGIFLKRDIKHPVELIFNAPVAAHALGEALDITFETDQIVAVLNRRRLTEDTTFGLYQTDPL